MIEALIVFILLLLVISLLPLDGKAKNIAYVILLVLVALWLLRGGLGL